MKYRDSQRIGKSKQRRILRSSANYSQARQLCNIWINDDSLSHTATSGNPDNEEAPARTLFDTGVLGSGQSSEEIYE